MDCSQFLWHIDNLGGEDDLAAGRAGGGGQRGCAPN